MPFVTKLPCLVRRAKLSEGGNFEANAIYIALRLAAAKHSSHLQKEN